MLPHEQTNSSQADPPYCKLNAVSSLQTYEKVDKILNKIKSPEYAELQHMWRALSTGNSIPVISFATTYLHCLIMALLRYCHSSTICYAIHHLWPCPHTEDLQ